MDIKQVKQISESHCGAAVLQMLLWQQNITTTQEEIADLAGVKDTILDSGMRIDQIALASTRLAPHFPFYYKFQASITDIVFLIDQKIPVGVEWQGLFYQSEEEEEEGGDYGHYSIITYIDLEQDRLIIVDPYKDFISQNRIFPIDSFLRRWWDTNEITNFQDGKTYDITDERLLFFVASPNAIIPNEMGFKNFQKNGINLLDHLTD